MAGTLRNPTVACKWGAYPKLILGGHLEQRAELVPRGRAQLSHRRGHVMLDGAPRNRERQRDLAIAHPVAGELHHLALAWGELAAVAPAPGAVRRNETAPSEGRPDAARIPRGSELQVQVHRRGEQPPALVGTPGQQRSTAIFAGPHRVVRAGQ